MSYTWINKTSNVYQKNSQSNQSFRQNGIQTKTKAYLNPEIVNCEFIRTSLPKNFPQRNVKIHVNPNFKGNALNKVLKNSHFNVNDTKKLLNEPGPSSIAGEVISKRLYSNENKRLNNTTVVAHQSRFKKVNVNLQSKNIPQYSQFGSIMNPDRFHSNLKINRIASVPVVESPQEKNKSASHDNSFKNTSKSLVKLPSQLCQSSKNISIYKSRTKIINGSRTKLLSSASPKNKLNFKDKKVYSPLKRHLSLSRFVYNNKISPITRMAKAVRTKYKYLSSSEEFRKSKYKIDKRNKLQETVKKKLNVIKDIRKLFPDYFYTKLKSPPYRIYQVNNCNTLPKNISSWRKNQISHKGGHELMNQFPNQRVVKIGGILYKSTTNKLTLANKSVANNEAKSVSSKSKAKKNHVVYVRGEKFILENNGKVLRRQAKSTKTKKSLFHTTKRIDIGGVTYVQKSQNVLICTNVHKARYLVNKAKNKSIAVLTNLRKKSSMPCMIYHRFGKCSRHTSGLCIYKHDPKNIAVCKNFLKGNCTKENCLLSHEVIQEKMATCHFFLNGLCVRENCPYLHVKLNKNVAICEDFLQGFCNLGKNCSKRHFHQCPEFDKHGTCSLGSKCHYPHKKQNKTELNTENVSNNSEELKDESEEVQYYVCSGVQKRPKRSKKMSSKEKESNMLKSHKKAGKRKALSLCSPQESEDLITCFPKRIRLDKLPCYIPLKSDS